MEWKSTFSSLIKRHNIKMSKNLMELKFLKKIALEISKYQELAVN